MCVAYIKYGVLLLVGLLFLLLGIQVLVGAYRMNDPFSFVLAFFAANFIILISAALCLGFVLRLLRLRRGGDTGEDPTAKVD
ncbi:MAG: hypothetical protein KFF50_12835 [Desulfatitalea sp.]|nr:hypothetical protein [Desulfatitalea sp.]